MQFRNIADSKKTLMEDEELSELEKYFIRKIESYIDIKFKPILEKTKIKINIIFIDVIPYSTLLS